VKLIDKYIKKRLCSFVILRLCKKKAGLNMGYVLISMLLVFLLITSYVIAKKSKFQIHTSLAFQYMNINLWKIGVFIKHDLPFRKRKSKLDELD